MKKYKVNALQLIIYSSIQLYLTVALYFTSMLSFGWAVISIYLITLLAAILSAYKRNEFKIILIHTLSFLIAIYILYLLFRVSLPVGLGIIFSSTDMNWGFGFVSLIVVYLTPFFIVVNSLILLDKKPKK